MIARALALGALALAIAALPAVAGSFYTNIASQMLIYAVFALGLNVLVGYAGLVSLGHAGIFGVAAYAAAWIVAGGYGHAMAALAALAAILLASALYALLSLRATGIGFLMITLAIGQILWGLAYRWISLTGGDNGIGAPSRPEPFGIALASPPAFYYFSLIVFLLAWLSMAIFVRSPFGASLMGTRDQPRRMTALGYNVWLIRFAAFLFSGFWSGVAGLLFCYYNEFVTPAVLTLGSSAEVLLMVIAGGSGTLWGPPVGAVLVVFMKYVGSAYITRWNLVLGVIFVAIVIFMPEGLVPGTLRLWESAWRRRDAASTARTAP